MVNHERYVHLPNSELILEDTRKVSHNVIEMINNANFYEEVLVEKEQRLSQAKKSAKLLKKEFSAFQELIDKDKQENKKKHRTTKKKTKKSSQKSHRTNIRKTEDDEYAFENLKENLKKLKQKLNK